MLPDPVKIQLNHEVGLRKHSISKIHRLLRNSYQKDWKIDENELRPSPLLDAIKMNCIEGNEFIVNSKTNWSWLQENEENINHYDPKCYQYPKQP